MNTRAETALTFQAPQPRETALPAGAGILLAMALGGAFWGGVLALLI